MYLNANEVFNLARENGHENLENLLESIHFQIQREASSGGYQCWVCGGKSLSLKDSDYILKQLRGEGFSAFRDNDGDEPWSIIVTWWFVEED